MSPSHYPTSAELASFRRALLAWPSDNINGPTPDDELDFLREWLADDTPGAHGSEDIIGMGARDVDAHGGERPHVLYMPAPDDHAELDALEVYGVGACTMAAATGGAWYAWLRRHSEDLRAGYWLHHPHQGQASCCHPRTGATRAELTRGLPPCACIVYESPIHDHAWHEHDCSAVGVARR